jgi:hypothetical protein
MKIPVGLLAAIVALFMAGSYAWTNREHIEKLIAGQKDVASEVAAESAPDEPTSAADDPTSIMQQSATFIGPLAKYVTHLTPLVGNSESSVPNAADRVLGRSPVGTSRALLNQTFAVNRIVDIPFELPAQAATPQLHGDFRALAQPQGKMANIAQDANLEFLVLSEKQYEDFLNERPAESLFSAEEAHDREVNVALPPTFGHRAGYHLVFRNNSPDVKKVVQANFRLDF